MPIINDIVISDMAFNSMVRKMHNRIVGCQNLFAIQQSSLDNYINDDFEESRIERNKKLKMWDEEWKWEKIEFKKKKQKEFEDSKIARLKAKQKDLENKYILKLKENSYRNELFYEEMNTTLIKYKKIIIRPNVVGNWSWYEGYGLHRGSFDLTFFKENRTEINPTKRFFGGSRKDYNYSILKHKILDKMIGIAKDNNFTSIEHIRFVFTKPIDSVNVFVYLSDICLFQIDLPEF
jgi:ribonuclease HIII